jgi:hypothetical protein
VNQVCPLSPLIFNVCIEPIFRYIKEICQGSRFKSDGLGERMKQGHAENFILIYDSFISKGASFINVRIRVCSY